MRSRIATAAAGLALLGTTAAAGPTPALDLNAVLREVAESHRAPEVNAGGVDGTGRQGPDQVVFRLYGEAWRTYAEVASAQMLVRHQEQCRAMLERIIKAALSAYQAGRGAYYELLAAEAARTRALADLSTVLGERRVARARLDILMGRVPGAGDDILIPPPIPDVPQDSSAWAAAVTPALFARSHQPGEVTKLEVISNSRHAEGEATELELRGQVLATHAAALYAQRRVRLLADTVVVAQQQAFDGAWSAYTGGDARLPLVLEAAEALFEQQRALILARRDVATAQARFVALTGRADLLGVTLPQWQGAHVDR